MESYQTIINATSRSLPAWDGTGVASDGCAVPTNYSLSSYSGGTPPSGETKEYDPFSVIERRVPEKSGGGKQWASARRKGHVRMTRYQRKVIVTRNYLVGVDVLGTSVYGRLAKKLGAHKEAGSCVKYCVNKEAQYSYHSWTEQGDYGHWADRGLPLVTLNTIDSGAISDAVRESRANAVVKSFKDYDALTEMFEFPETAKMMHGSAVNALSSFRKFTSRHAWSDLRIAYNLQPKKLLKNSSRALRNLASDWMQYRYGWMPVIYSMSDIVKLHGRTKWTTDKARTSVMSESLSPDIPSNGCYISKEVSGEVSVASTVTCAYSTSSMARLSRFGVNPLSTAWELIPYSFVADWFVNVGDYITANMSLGFQSHVGACSAIKKTLTETYTLHYKNDQTLVRNLTVLPPGNECWPTGTYPWSESVSFSGDGVLRTVETESYSRSPFSREGSVSLQVSPFLNWKRYLDGTVLASNQIRALMRSIRNGSKGRV